MSSDYYLQSIFLKAEKIFLNNQFICLFYIAGYLPLAK